MRRCFTCGGIFDLEEKAKQVVAFEELMSAPDFWDHQESAKETIEKCNLLKAWTEPYDALKKQLDDLAELFEEVEEKDPLFEELKTELASVEKGVEELEFKKMLSGELDGKNCYLSINAGAGGTESCDWALMLMRMYSRFAEREGWKVEEVDLQPGEVAGIKSVTLKLTGAFAYGYMKAEKGVHRLVRISPFDSNAKRHTSFASVDASPEITDDISIEIGPQDLRIDTYRASGAGGQHVNKTESAVRITHMPSGIVVSCQSERSQLQNRETCMKMLRSKLYEKEVLERESELRALSGEKKEIAWGSQIRNYVFQPYTLVKDTRTGAESGNIQAVMDGEIGLFINAYLKEFSS